MNELRPTLSAATWQHLVDTGQPRNYPTGSLLMAEGDPGGVVLALISGRVTVTVGEGGHVATLGPGDLIGELSAVDGLPRSASVEAETDVEVRALRAPALIDALQLHQPDAVPILRAAVRSIRAATEATAIEAGGAPVGHVAGWLASQFPAGAESKQLFVDLDPAVVAEALEISPELLSRSLGHLEGAGALVLDRGRVLILDVEILRQLGDPR